MKLLIPLLALFGLSMAGVGTTKKILFNQLHRSMAPKYGKGAAVPFETVENSLEQHLDNFDNQNMGRFQQRYFMNGEHFQPGGPLIVLLGGEWPIDPWIVHNSLPAELAAENKGYLFYLEHRFYGKSIPTSDLSTDNLKFLNVDQALADIAHFIHYIKSTYVTPGAEHSHVILVGSHYSGSLAVWFRQKYPHLAVGAWASSSPLLAKLNHHEFLEISGAVYRQFGGDSCYNRIQRGFQGMEKMIAEGKQGELSDLFHLCNPIKSINDQRLFLSGMAEIFSFLILAENDWLFPISDICDKLAENDDAVESIATLMETIFNSEEYCIESGFNETVQFYSNSSLDAPAADFGARQWVYQTCDHLGWFHSSLSENQPFGSGFPVDIFLDVCPAIYGNRFTRETIEENIDRQNTIHGGDKPDVTNVLFTHGQLDPWRSAGVQENVYHNATVIVIPGATQSNDLRPFSEFESPTLTEAKIQILELLHYWLNHASGIEIVPIKG